MNADRVSGMVIMLFSLILIYIVIPIGVESIESDGLAPTTFPVLLSWGLFIVGSIQLIVSKKSDVVFPSGLIRIAFICICFFTAIYCAFIYGFIYISPVLALIMMLFMNERRILWLLLGTIFVPLAIWFCIDIVLGRELI